MYNGEKYNAVILPDTAQKQAKMNQVSASLTNIEGDT